MQGVIAAAITPLKPDFSPNLDAISGYLDFLVRRGCHGALLLGTTGEGPSFSPQQRKAVFRAALEIRQDWPEFQLLAGTGTPSMEETIDLTQSVFELGFDGVVILPPYYYQKSGVDGLFQWYANILDQAVPPNGTVLGYHIPAVSGVPLSLELLSNLRYAYPHKFVGIKDSSGEAEFPSILRKKFGKDFQLFIGNDRLFNSALNNGASGCITATANLISPDLRKLFEAFHNGQPRDKIQERIATNRGIIEKFPPFPPLIKFLLAHFFDFPLWPVCPPLTPIAKETGEQVSRMLELA
jgi:4-hydroxy-tetrahydrodipicolinate synthase